MAERRPTPESQAPSSPSEAPPVRHDAPLLTSRAVQELLQIGRTKLWELVRAGAFPAYRIGEGRNSSLRYRREDVLRWLECQRVRGAGALEAGG